MEMDVVDITVVSFSTARRGFPRRVMTADATKEPSRLFVIEAIACD